MVGGERAAFPWREERAAFPWWEEKGLLFHDGRKEQGKNRGEEKTENVPRIAEDVPFERI